MIVDYFRTNDTPDTTPSGLWAAHKAMIRGKLIQIASQINRSWRADIDKLEGEFSTLSKKHEANPKSIPIGSLDADHSALNLAHTSKAEKWLSWNRARFIGTLLANRLTQRSTLSQNPQRIMGEFHHFYKKTVWCRNTSITVRGGWVPGYHPNPKVGRVP